MPPKVAINEAVELAKAFGSDNSSRFINGVLGTAFRQIDPEAATKDNHDQPTKEENAVPETSSDLDQGAPEKSKSGQPSKATEVETPDSAEEPGDTAETNASDVVSDNSAGEDLVA